MMDEFEEMRQQLASMKSQLDTQAIVNKDLMRNIMRHKASWLNVLVTSELIIMPFVYLLVVGLCYAYGVSQWFSFVFLILGSIDAILDIRTVRIPKKLFSAATIVDLKKFLVRQKKERFVQMCISSSLAILWFILLFSAMVASNKGQFATDNAWNAARTGGIVGGIIGIIAAIAVIILLFRKMQTTNDAIIADINELEKEN